MGAGVSKGRSSQCPVSRSGLPGEQTTETADGAGSGSPAPPCSLSPLLGVTGQSRGPSPPPENQALLTLTLGPSANMSGRPGHGWLRWREPAGSTVSTAGMQAFRFHFKDLQTLLCAPQAPRRETDPAKLARCLRVSSSPGCARARVWVCAWAHTSVPGCGSGQPPPGNVSESRRCEVDAHAPVVRNPGGFQRFHYTPICSPFSFCFCQ